VRADILERTSVRVYVRRQVVCQGIKQDRDRAMRTYLIIKMIITYTQTGRCRACAQ
jgi:hypothetical protein